LLDEAKFLKLFLLRLCLAKNKNIGDLSERQRGQISIFGNIGDKESSSDLETGAEPHRLELEEEFGKNLVSKKEICEAKRFFSLSPVQRFLIYQKHELTHKASS
jgi:hypothetical protein